VKRAYIGVHEAPIGWAIEVWDKDAPWGSPPVGVSYQVKRPTLADKKAAVWRHAGPDAVLVR
jgi:hypothetical protein